MNDLVTSEVPKEPTGSGLVQMIERLAVNPDVDVNKLEKLLDIQIAILAKQAQQEFYAAKTLVQKEMPAIPKDAKNEQTGSWYSRLETVIRYSTPVITKHGFSLSFSEGETTKPNHIRVVCKVSHSAGHCEEEFIDIPLDDKGAKGTVNKTATHAVVSSFSYGQRRLQCAIFNLPTGDDNDGNNDPALELVSEGQIAEIEKLLKDTKSDRKQFESWVQKNLKAQNIESLNQNGYEAAIRTLKNKKDRQSKPSAKKEEA